MKSKNSDATWFCSEYRQKIYTPDNSRFKEEVVHNNDTGDVYNFENELSSLEHLHDELKPYGNDCSAGISGENICKLAVKIMARHHVLFGLRYFVGKISFSSLVLLLTASVPK